MTDPVFRALAALGEGETPGTRAYCQMCHSNVGTVSRELALDMPYDNLALVVREGVTCESCHRIQGVFRPSNAGHVLDPNGPMQGTAQAGDGSPYHDTERSEVLATAELCASCHDVEGPRGVILEQPYLEWSRSPAKAGGSKCADCHMPMDGYGPAARGFGLSDRPLRRHTFLGPGALAWASELEVDDAEELRSAVLRQLRESVSLSLVTPVAATPGAELQLQVVLRSRVDGHRFPTGSAFFRQLWGELRVTDDGGTPVFRRNGMSDRGAAETEATSLFFSARLMDAQNRWTHFPWRATHVDNRSLEPLESRSIDFAFDVPSTIVGSLTVEARLHFRTFPEELLQVLGLPSDLGLELEVGAAARSLPRVP